MRPTTPRRPTPSTPSGSSTATGSTSGVPSGSPGPGAWIRVEIADESILVVRGKDEQIRAFYNVCRHRGSRICDDEQGEVRTHLRCPYHAWGYALDGTLAITPMIDQDEIDRPSTSLWPVHVDVWEGFVFVNLSREEPRPLLEHLADQHGRAAEAWRGSAWPTCGSATSRPPRSRRTGRSSSRTTTSACTARRSTPSWWPWCRRTRRGPSSRTAATTAASPWPTGAPRSRRTRGCGCRCCRGSAEQDDARVLLRRPGLSRRCSSTSTGPRCLATAIFPTGPQSCRLVTEYLFSPEAVDGPRLRPVAGRQLQRAGDPAGQRRVRAGPARRDVTGVRARRLPGQGRAGSTSSTSATCATSRPSDPRPLLTRGRRAHPAPGRRRAGEHRVELQLDQLGVGGRDARDPGDHVGQRVQVDRPAPPRARGGRGAPRRDSSSARAASADTGARAHAVSSSTSVRTPPRPTMTTGPNLGSRTLPTISSTPSARSAIASTETAGGASRATRSAYAARASVAVREAERPPRRPSDLCSRPVALSTTGKPSPGDASAASSPAASVTDTATGKRDPRVREQRPGRVVRRVGDGRRRRRELLGEAGRRRLDEAGQHRAARGRRRGAPGRRRPAAPGWRGCPGRSSARRAACPAPRPPRPSAGPRPARVPRGRTARPRSHRSSRSAGRRRPGRRPAGPGPPARSSRGPARRRRRGRPGW